MYHKLDNEIKRINNVIEEILPYQIMKIIEINNWDFFQGEKVEKVNIGYNWDYNVFPVKFRKEIDIPDGYYGEFWFGGETLIKVDGKPYGEINEEAEKINKPLRVLKKKVEIKDKILDFNPLKVIAAFKKDNNLIVRLVEVEGKRGKCKFNIKYNYNNVYLSNILLDEKQMLSKNAFDYKQFKIYTLIFE